MSKIEIITGRVSEAGVLAIANSSGFRNLMDLRQGNDNENGSDIPRFTGDYSRLFDAMHGIRSMSDFLDEGPLLYIQRA